MRSFLLSAITLVACILCTCCGQSAPAGNSPVPAPKPNTEPPLFQRPNGGANVPAHLQTATNRLWGCSATVTGLVKNPDSGERVVIFQGCLTEGGKDRLCIVRTLNFGTSDAASRGEIELCERVGLSKISQGEIKLGGLAATKAVMEKGGDQPYLQGMYWTKAGHGELGWYVFWEAFGPTRNETAAILTKAAESVRFFNTKEVAAKRPGYFVSSRFGMEINVEQFNGKVAGLGRNVVMSWSWPESREVLGTFYVQTYAKDQDQQAFLDDFESHRGDLAKAGTLVNGIQGTTFGGKPAVRSTLDKKGASVRSISNELRIWDDDIIWIVTECHAAGHNTENEALLKAAFDSFKLDDD